jgi:hypothetical protein
MSDDKLRRFFEAVEKVRQTQALDEKLRLSIAREMGLSDEELAQAKNHGEASLARGEGFLRSGMYSDAMVALGEADALLPDDRRVMFALAQAHFHRFRSFGKKENREAARKLVHRCLQIAPSEQTYFSLLKGLDDASKKESSRRGLFIWGGVSAVILGGAIAGGVYMSGKLERDKEKFARRLEERWGAPARTGSVEGCPGKLSYCSVEAPVTIAPEVTGLTVSDATFRLSPEERRLELPGRYTHVGKTELKKLALAARLLDKDGAEVGRLPFDAHADFSPPMRAGDSDVFFLSEDIPGATRSVEIVSVSKNEEAAPSTYDTPPTMKLDQNGAPSHFQIEVGVRSIEHNTFKAASSITGVVAITNRGEGVIRELVVEIRGLDESGAAIEKASLHTLVLKSMPPLEPGERRVETFTLYSKGAKLVSEEAAITRIE